MAARRDTLIDAGIALAVFAATLALVAAGDGIDPAGAVLAALASLPLAARRRAPLAVFVATALASTALAAGSRRRRAADRPDARALLRPRRPAGASGGRRDRRGGGAAPRPRAAGGLARDAFPGAELPYGVRSGAAPGWPATARGCAASGWPSSRSAPSGPSARRSGSAGSPPPRSATRIARDLHDSAGHAINVILVHAGLGRMRSGDAGEFETIEQVARETIGEIDQLVGALREGAADADVEPPPGLAALAALVERHREAGLDVTTAVRRRAARRGAGGGPRRLPDPAGGADQRRAPRRRERAGGASASTTASS